MNVVFQLDSACGPKLGSCTLGTNFTSSLSIQEIVEYTPQVCSFLQTQPSSNLKSVVVDVHIIGRPASCAYLSETWGVHGYLSCRRRFVSASFSRIAIRGRPFANFTVAGSPTGHPTFICCPGCNRGVCLLFAREAMQTGECAILDLYYGFGRL